MPKCNLSNTSSCVSIYSWNVAGLFLKTINKITDSAFLKELLPYDIGTKLSEKLTDYENNCILWKLALLIRNTIRNAVEMRKNFRIPMDKTMRVLFSFGILGIYICFSYILPCNFQTKSDSDSILRLFIRDINLSKNTGHILMCGDLNTKTRSELDFIIDNTDNHIP